MLIPRILLCDAEEDRLAATFETTRKLFGEDTILQRNFSDHDPKTIQRELAEAASAAHRHSLGVVLISNIDGIDTGVIRDILEATEGSARVILSTCYIAEAITGHAAKYAVPTDRLEHLQSFFHDWMPTPHKKRYHEQLSALLQKPRVSLATHIEENKTRFKVPRSAPFYVPQSGLLQQ